ncbi:septum formation initiator family protein [Arthrobacter sp. B0490]|uniref:FtsB family cell division protein n=1 Tax=Arthrobacter sp. B0490 TaxID=2058891 RepID=UPI0011B06FD6|nr:septum formation initiator family protein [Arthrobacter sp. B0490]
MTARRPNVPRAGRPTPAAEERPAPGPAKGPTPDHGRGAGHTPAPSRSGPIPSPARVAATAPRKPSAPRAAGPSATKDPRTAAGTHRSDASRTTAATSPSEARAAERSQLAGSIRRGRLGSKRAESPIQPAEEATPIPAKTFSGRLLALAVVLVAVIVLLAPSVSRYLQQQGELDALRADIARQQQEQADYQSELARWDDPAFVKQQARERIFLVMPGETRYLVKGGEGIEDSTGEGSAAEPADLPWVDSLWSSVVRAATD